MAAKTRLIVKNLPKHLTEERFRQHFATQGAEITDAKILHKDGKSRQFGFIGLRTEAEARAVASFFNGTYLDTSRISVETAKPIGDRTGAWSRHTPGTSAFATRNPIPAPAPTIAADKDASASSKTKSKAAEALAVLQPRASTARPYWANDDAQDGAVPTKAKAKAQILELKKQEGKRVETALVPSKQMGAAPEQVEKREHVYFEDSDSENADGMGNGGGDEHFVKAYVDGEDAEVLSAAQAPDTAAANEQISDLDYLRSKMSEHFSDQEDSVPDESAGGVAVLRNTKLEEKEEKKDDKKSTEKLKDKDAVLVISEGDAKARAAAEGDEEEAVGESGRLMLRNLPFSITEDELLKHLQRFGPVSELRLPLDPVTHKPRGMAFVLYMVPHDAVKAMATLDGAPFLGRLLHVMPARAPPSKAPASEVDADSTRRKRTVVQEEKEKKKKTASASEQVWNALFLRSDTVASAAARGLGVAKSALLTEGTSPALQLALAETSVVAETRAFLTSHGVALLALEQAASGKSTERSNTVLLVKNLPPDTDEQQLRVLFEKHGPLLRLVLPPSRALALVEYGLAPDARAAFRSLNYARFQHVPLYLEWAPQSSFSAPPDTKSKPATASAPVAPAATSKASKRKAERAANVQAVVASGEAHEDEEGEGEGTGLSVFVKNLSFASTEADLKAHAVALGVQMRSVTVASKKDAGGKQLSMGFGFIECASKDQTHAAVRLLHGSQLGGHALIAKLSTRAGGGASSGKRRKGASADEQKASRKVMVKNVAFEATSKELRALFEPFGAVQRVRLPRKADGQHRGFAFVDMATKQDAKSAMAALSATHLYGRRLVLDFAKDDDEKASVPVDHTSEFIPL